MRVGSVMRLVVLAVLAVAVTGGGASASPGVTTRVSVDSAGNQGNGKSFDAAISADGRYVAFASWASNLVPGDTNTCSWYTYYPGMCPDVFVHDTQTGETARVSVDSAGNQANGESAYYGFDISADGRYIAFQSYASNLVAEDTNGFGDIFVHDRQTGETTRVSVNSASEEGNGNARYPALSADGRYVAFYSTSSNLVPGDTNGRYDAFVHDREMGETTRVSVDSAGNEANDWSGYKGLDISADGRYVAFESFASNLVPGDTNGYWDIFVHDCQTGETTRVSVDSAGNQANEYASYLPSISVDGRFLAFESTASNLVPGDTNGTHDVFVHDRRTGETTRVSVDSAGNQGWSSSGYRGVAISADGRFIAFESFSSNLVPKDSNGCSDVLVHDRQTGETTRVSVDSAGNQGDHSSYYPAISADGRYIAFESRATNLVPGDTNDACDVFIHDQGPLGPTPTPTNTATPTPTTPPGVGGTVKLPPGITASESATPADGSSPSANHIALAGATAVVVLAAGGWYARRRWLR